MGDLHGNTDMKPKGFFSKGSKGFHKIRRRTTNKDFDFSSPGADEERHKEYVAGRSSRMWERRLLGIVTLFVTLLLVAGGVYLTRGVLDNRKALAAEKRALAKELEKNPSYASVLLTGQLLKEQGSYLDAIKHFSQLESMYPDSVAPRIAKAETLMAFCLMDAEQCGVKDAYILGLLDDYPENPAVLDLLNY